MSDCILISLIQYIVIWFKLKFFFCSKSSPTKLQDQHKFSTKIIFYSNKNRSLFIFLDFFFQRTERFHIISYYAATYKKGSIKKCKLICSLWNCIRKQWKYIETFFFWASLFFHATYFRGFFLFLLSRLLKDKRNKKKKTKQKKTLKNVPKYKVIHRSNVTQHILMEITEVSFVMWESHIYDVYHYVALLLFFGYFIPRIFKAPLLINFCNNTSSMIFASFVL